MMLSDSRGIAASSSCSVSRAPFAPMRCANSPTLADVAFPAAGRCHLFLVIRGADCVAVLTGRNHPLAKCDFVAVVASWRTRSGDREGRERRKKKAPAQLRTGALELSVSAALGYPASGRIPVRHSTRRSPTRTPPPPNPTDYCPMDHLLFGACQHGGTQSSRSRGPPEPSGIARGSSRADEHREFCLRGGGLSIASGYIFNWLDR